MIVQEHKKGEKISCTNEMEEKKRGCYNGSIKSKEAAAPQKKVQRLFLFPALQCMPPYGKMLLYSP